MRMTLKDYKLLAFLLVVPSLAVAYFDNQNASGMGVLTQAGDAASDKRERKARAAAERAEVERVLTQAKNAVSNRLAWRDNYKAAIKESKATGKPIFLEFRCAP